MAFGDLTTRSNIDFTQSKDFGLNAINKNFGKFTFNKAAETVPMTNPINEEPIGVLNKDEEGHINGLG